MDASVGGVSHLGPWNRRRELFGGSCQHQCVIARSVVRRDQDSTPPREGVECSWKLNGCDLLQKIAETFDLVAVVWR